MSSFKGEAVSVMRDSLPTFPHLRSLNALPSSIATPSTCYKSLSGPSGPKCPRGCPRKRGCPRECPTGCPRGPLGPLGPGVSNKCPRSVKKVSGTLRGHSRDTFWTLRSPGPKGPRGDPVGHSLGHPRFRGHPRGHSRDTLGPKGPRDSCSRSGGGCNSSMIRRLS